MNNCLSEFLHENDQYSIFGQFRGNVNLGMVYKSFLKCILLGVISKNMLWTFVKIQRLIFVTCCVAMETM